MKETVKSRGTEIESAWMKVRKLLHQRKLKVDLSSCSTSSSLDSDTDEEYSHTATQKMEIASRVLKESQENETAHV